MPAILRIYNMFKGNEFAIIGISLDRGRGRLVKYLRENKVDWPIIFDGKGWKNRVAQQYQAHGIPFTVLLDGKGIVRKVGLRGEKLEDAIAALLSPAGE